MRWQDVFQSWQRILAGRRPVLSIEITTACPLSCPGCYAYQPTHLAGQPITSLSDKTGEELVQGILSLIERQRPVGIYLVGGEPLVRFRELDRLLPEIDRRGIGVEVVTSAVRPIPASWARLSKVRMVVSIDGLQPEHDERRKPATYERILKHIAGHSIHIHCTVTAQMMDRPGYLDEFCRFWSPRPEVDSIRISFFTPQKGERAAERLTPEMRRQAVGQLAQIRHRYPKLRLNDRILATYLNPPQSPEECLFASVTHCVSADLKTVVTPCQFGGDPNCSECGCLASVALKSVAETRLLNLISIRALYQISRRMAFSRRYPSK